jgi:hypothetical protein
MENPIITAIMKSYRDNKQSVIGVTTIIVITGSKPKKGGKR